MKFLKINHKNESDIKCEYFNHDSVMKIGNKSQFLVCQLDLTKFSKYVLYCPDKNYSINYIGLMIDKPSNINLMTMNNKFCTIFIL